MPSEIKYGIGFVQFNEFADPELAIEFAVEAEKAGWDGIFLIDHVYFSREDLPSIAETWILLSAIAARTERIKIGTSVTALPRYPPFHSHFSPCGLAFLASSLRKNIHVLVAGLHDPLHCVLRHGHGILLPAGSLPGRVHPVYHPVVFTVHHRRRHQAVLCCRQPWPSIIRGR